jgi:hypothetical protein
MTLPDERYRSVMWAKRFLEGIAHDRKAYPRIAKSIRGEAYSILRHFPSEWDMTRAADAAPEVFQERIEPVTRLMAQYEQNKNEN